MQCRDGGRRIVKAWWLSVMPLQRSSQHSWCAPCMSMSLLVLPVDQPCVPCGDNVVDRRVVTPLLHSSQHSWWNCSRGWCVPTLFVSVVCRLSSLYSLCCLRRVRPVVPVSITVSVSVPPCRQARARLADIFRGKEARAIATAGVMPCSNGVAVSRDGSTLLLSDEDFGSHAIHEFRVEDGSRLRVIGGAGDGPLQFKGPRQVWIASDDYVFVAELGNKRVQVLTPRLDFHTFVGEGQLVTPSGVCADDDIIMVSERDAHRISVFSRGDGALLRRFGSLGSGDDQLNTPCGLCFITGMPVSGRRHVAVADHGNSRVSVFSVEGEFVRHVGVGELNHPHGVACSAHDEVVVADTWNSRVAVFSASGEVLHATRMGDGNFTGVAIHGGTIFAPTWSGGKCVVFT
jgi:sugar lactone lactonase YvrE